MSLESTLLTCKQTGYGCTGYSTRTEPHEVLIYLGICLAIYAVIFFVARASRREKERIERLRNPK